MKTNEKNYTTLFTVIGGPVLKNFYMKGKKKSTKVKETTFLYIYVNSFTTQTDLKMFNTSITIQRYQ